MNNIDIDKNDKLNDDWINIFENTDKLYQDFYKDDLYYINIDLIYINQLNEIEKIKQDSILMSIENCITREELIGLLKRNSIDNDKRYTLMSILKYNITLDAEDINSFLLSNNYDSNIYNEDDNYDTDDFLTVIKHIDTIHFDKSIHMFQDLNNIFFIFYEKPKNLNQSNNVSKKIYLTSGYNHNNNKHNKHKKTIKK